MSANIIPPFLKPGDTIGICAVARKISREEIEPAIKMIEAQGYYVAVSKNLFGSSDQFSGTDEQRAEDLQAFLDDDNIKAVISARGGYGTLRIIDKIDFSNFRKHPKWMIGYSDITVLHSHIHSNLHICTLHATMPINFQLDEFSTQTLFNSLAGTPESYRYRNELKVKNRIGDCEGELVGGNLSLLYAMQNSVSDIDTDGKILFIEDLDEYLYHVDRMILSLKRAGKFSGLKGLIVGGMDEMKDNKIPFGKSAEEIIREHVAEYDFPVCYNFPAGHGTKNYALTMGAKVKLTVEKDSAELETLL
ncbi:MAG TPA: LD-carboxypeptidase [Bacteroidia bacterium]|jgi:muramoyltetrapeptide carboxypeptidase|nr:LD-carboxypeptidase [Bacteroidia bacterium]